MNENTKIKNLLKYTTVSEKSYNGSLYEAGYHTLNIHGEIVPGQRQPSKRLDSVPFDFNNKVVLDMGSNQGGMLFEIQNKIKEGIGIDFNHRLVNVANKIKQSHDYSNLSFYVFDLENEDLNLIKNFLKNEIDIIFLLSICMWIKNWKDLCIWCSKNASACLFESNGAKNDQEDQFIFLKSIYKNVHLIREKSIDDPIQHKRKLYYCDNL
jgi:hypothetical protein